MSRYRRGWGRSYGAGERLPDPDPTPPEDDDVGEDGEDGDPIDEQLRELGRALDERLGAPDPAALERLRERLRERLTRRG